MIFGEYKYELFKNDNLLGYVKYECLKKNSEYSVQQSVYLKGVNTTRDVMIMDRNGELENIILSRRGKKIYEMNRIYHNIYILEKETYVSFKALKYYPLMIYQKENFETQNNIFYEKIVLNYAQKGGIHFENMISLIDENKLTILSPGRLKCKYTSNGLLETCFDATTEYRIELQ